MKMRNINLTIFSIFLIALIFLPIFCVDKYLSHPDIPWQLVPFGADSLSSHYKQQYAIMDARPLFTHLSDTTKKVVNILVDGWGVPYDEHMIEEDFNFFAQSDAFFSMHKRLLQYNAHIENVEYRVGFEGGILIENGDTSTCAKKDINPGNHFKQTICCKDCDDVKTITMLDSLIATQSFSKIAWTVHEPRDGDRKKLHKSLSSLSSLVTKHSDVQFIIQGTHRPLLGPPEIRHKYLAHWAPAVFIHCSLTDLVEK